MPPERDLIDPGAMLSTTHELGDGSRARLRLTRPTDLPKIAEFLANLTPETRMRRFMAATPEVSPAALRHFAFYDPRERLTLAATRPGASGEEILALADVALLNTGLAEIGVVVDDDAQGQGLGSLMSEAVASLAIQRGATHLKAEMLEGNEAMMRLMRRLGSTVHSVENGTTVAYTRLPASRRRRAA
jgi:RimJ/RimL family protein N-acetyltransferase